MLSPGTRLLWVTEERLHHSAQTMQLLLHYHAACTSRTRSAITIWQYGCEGTAIGSEAASARAIIVGADDIVSMQGVVVVFGSRIWNQVSYGLQWPSRHVRDIGPSWDQSPAAKINRNTHKALFTWLWIGALFFIARAVYDNFACVRLGYTIRWVPYAGQ